MLELLKMGPRNLKLKQRMEKVIAEMETNRWYGLSYLSNLADVRKGRMMHALRVHKTLNQMENRTNGYYVNGYYRSHAEWRKTTSN